MPVIRRSSATSTPSGPISQTTLSVSTSFACEAVGSGGDRVLVVDGRQLAVTAQAGVSTWDLDPEHLLDAACQLAGRNLTETEWSAYMSEFGSQRETCPHTT
jgi:hypothetical protein